MSDRELLEAAAKAEGRTLTYMTQYVAGREPEVFIASWNPLADDGDALRLAVKLNLDVEFDTLPDGPIVGVVAPWNDEFGEYRWYEWLHKDALAATRRAIVRAAAALGEQR